MTDRMITITDPAYGVYRAEQKSLKVINAKLIEALEDALGALRAAAQEEADYNWQHHAMNNVASMTLQRAIAALALAKGEA